MANKTKTQNQKPCCTDEVVTKDKIIEIINAIEKFEDDDARTCFWLYVEGLNGNPDKKQDFGKVLGIMESVRPNAHQRILANASDILNAK